MAVMGEHLILLKKYSRCLSHTCFSVEKTFSLNCSVTKQKKKQKKKQPQGELPFFNSPHYSNIPKANTLLAGGNDNVSQNENLCPILMQMSQSAFDPVLIAQ